jgi:hypothetical protein
VRFRGAGLTPTARWSAAMPFVGGAGGAGGGAACDADVASMEAYLRSRLDPPCEGPVRSESLRVGYCAAARSREALRPSLGGGGAAGSKSRRAVVVWPLVEACASERPAAGWAAA